MEKEEYLDLYHQMVLIRRVEDDVVDGDGHHPAPRVTHGRHGAGDVDPVHQSAAAERAVRIRVVGHDDLAHVDDGSLHRATRHGSGHRSDLYLHEVFGDLGIRENLDGFVQQSSRVMVARRDVDQ